jgi:hypothetical protein
VTTFQFAISFPMSTNSLRFTSHGAIGIVCQKYIILQARPDALQAHPDI